MKIRLFASLKDDFGSSFIEIPKIKKGRTHVFYSYAMKINDKITKVHRDQIWRMLIKEGIPVNNNIPCIHRLPIFKKKIA